MTESLRGPQKFLNEDVAVKVIIVLQAVDRDREKLVQDTTIGSHRYMMVLSQVVENHSQELQAPIMDSTFRQKSVIECSQAVGGHQDDRPPESLGQIGKGLKSTLREVPLLLWCE